MPFRNGQLLLLGVARKLDHLQPVAYGLRDRVGIGGRHDPQDRGQVERHPDVLVPEREAALRVEDVEQRLGRIGPRPVDGLEDEDRVPHPGLAQAAENAPGGVVLAPADPPRGIVLAQRHVHGAAERPGGGHGQRRLARPPGSGQARDAYRRPERPWAYEQRRPCVLPSSAAGRGFHGEEAARPPARRQHLDEAALDAVEAAVRAVQRLSQMDRVEPRRRALPPRQGHGQRGTVQRLLHGLAPGRERLPESAPQDRVDDGRQFAALQGREHPIDAWPGRDERAYGPELLGLAVPRREHGPSREVGQLDCGRGPLRGIAEHLERLCLAHHARPGRQVGQAPPVPLLLGRDHVAAVFRSARPTNRAVTGPRAGRAAEPLQRLAIFIQRRRIDEQHLSGVFTPQNLHAHLVRPSRIPLATRGATGTVVPPAPGRGEWWSGWGEARPGGRVTSAAEPYAAARTAPGIPIRRIPAAG